MLDFIIIKAINEFGRGTLIDSISKIISSNIFMTLLISLVVLIIIFKERKHTVKILSIIAIVIILHFFFTNFLIKGIIANQGFERIRPYISYPNEIVPVGNLSTDSSFPSGHVSIIAAVLFVPCYFYRKKFVWIFSGILIVLMALSRIHNGMHYPSDVLFGALFGLIYGFVVIKIAKYFRKKAAYY